MAAPESCSIRRLKPAVIRLIQTSSLQEAINGIHNHPPSKAVNVLLSLLYHPDEQIFWTAVILIGEVVSRLVNHQAESGRIIMRRLMWNLNDESGGIGWGAPETMGEIMARSDLMAREYGRILISYIRPDGNYIEHPVLQRGVLWGLGRLIHTHPEHGDDMETMLIPFFKSPDPQIRGLAAWTASANSHLRISRFLTGLKDDDASVRFWHNGHMIQTTVRRLLAGNPV
ncbi:MAG: DVU0298 family protein [Desulfatirhabdiaceae bacterium]